MQRILLVACWFAAIACGAAHAEGVGVLPLQVISKEASFRLNLQSHPAPLPLNELFEITVSVDVSAAADDSSNPVWLRASAEMPEHKHGMNTRVIVEQLGDGRFVLKGLLFHMRGEWLITFDVAKGRVHEQATARVQL
ncbi:MAG TPA: hypothetical protein VFS58_13980 [Steroidobacteraceae bacterium]|nr:hypothetical protein [Steroidobacteraceae bacterium]